MVSRRLGIAAATALTLGALGIAPAPAGAAVYTGIEVFTSPSSGSGTIGSYFDDTIPFPQPQPEAAVRVIRNGVQIGYLQGPGGSILFPLTLAIGDTVQVEQPPGSVVESIVYDGRPTIDASACIGSRAISGQRSSPGATIFAESGFPFQYGGGQGANITSLVGTSYAGIFPRPLASGEYVAVYQFEDFSTPYGVFSYYASREQAVGACQSSAPAPINTVGTTGQASPKPPKGSISISARGALRALFAGGLAITVTVDQPGKIVANVFLDGGRLPARATSWQSADSSKKKRKGRAKQIARGTTTAKKAGKVKVVVRPTKAGKRLRRKRSVKVALLTTLTNTAGQSTTLKPKRVKLKR